MPSGWIHGQITTAAAGVTYLWAVKSGEPPDLAAAAAVGCALGVLLTPDLDISGTRSDYLVKEQIGVIPGIIWRLLWYPYSTLIPHRSLLSHGPIIGTAIRLIYIWIPLSFIPWLEIPGLYLSRGICGLLISDNLHIGADFITTFIKNCRNRGIVAKLIKGR